MRGGGGLYKHKLQGGVERWWQLCSCSCMRWHVHFRPVDLTRSSPTCRELLAVSGLLLSLERSCEIASFSW